MAGDDEGAAAAALAGYLRRTAQAAGANLTRVEPAAAAEAGSGVRALPVAVTGESDLEGLLTFLQLLESGPKLVHVRDLRLEAARARRARAARAARTAATAYTPGPRPRSRRSSPSASPPPPSPSLDARRQRRRWRPDATRPWRGAGRCRRRRSCAGRKGGAR